MHIRKKGTRFSGKTAVEAGQAPKDIGLTDSRVDQPNGPVLSAVGTGSGGDLTYDSLVRNIARNVNADIEDCMLCAPTLPVHALQILLGLLLAELRSPNLFLLEGHQLCPNQSRAPSSSLQASGPQDFMNHSIVFGVRDRVVIAPKKDRRT